MINMPRYNKEATGFYNYNLYSSDFIYFWSKKVVDEPF